MDPAAELAAWLKRPEHGFEKNLDFAIKAWNCVEFIYVSKYEIIMSWFCDEFLKYAKEKAQCIDWDKIKAFVSMKFDGGILADGTTKRFINTIVGVGDIANISTKFESFEVSKSLSEHLTLQKFYRSHLKIYCYVQALVLKSFTNFLHNSTITRSEIQEIIEPVIKNMVDFLRRTSNTKNLIEPFTTNTLQHIVQLIIKLEQKKLNYMPELIEVQSIVYFNTDKNYLLKEFPCEKLHVSLKNYECMICHFKLHDEFLKGFILYIFNSRETLSNDLIRQWLIEISHVLHLFQKYDIKLIDQLEGDVNGRQFLSEKILEYVGKYSGTHLFEILSILCNTIKFNPLILEPVIFHVVIKCMFCHKSTKEYGKYEEFLTLFIKMFVKLNRREKLVSQLIKGVVEYLKENKLSKRRKHRIQNISSATESIEDPPKKVKVVEDDNCEKMKPIPSDCTEQGYQNNYFLEVLLFESMSTSTAMEALKDDDEWPNISSAWPARSAGTSFSNFVSTLMTKPSLVTCKTLIFSLENALENISAESTSENDLFLIEFLCALLCQYFAGSRIIEKADLFWSDIEKLQAQIQGILKNFGNRLLNFKHSARTMNSFLNLCYYVGNFDLMICYYCPDSIRAKLNDGDKQLENIHSYLTQDEWILIEQRIVNFGKNACKTNINRLYLQRMKSRLLQTSKAKINANNFLVSSTFTDHEQLEAILKTDNKMWFANILRKEQKIKICEMLTESEITKQLDNIAPLLENHEFLEIFTYVLYKKIASSFDSKKSILKSIDYDQICNNDLQDDNIVTLVNLFNENTKPSKIKKYSPELVEEALLILQNSSFAYCKKQVKEFIFACNLLLYVDLSATRNDQTATLCLQVFKNLLYLGNPIQVFELLDVKKLVETIPPSRHSQFYKLVFKNISVVTEQTNIFLENLVSIFTANAPNLSQDLLTLAVTLTDTFPDLITFRKIKKFYETTLKTLLDCIKHFFVEDCRDNEKDKEFVIQTLSPFASLVNTLLGKKEASEETDLQFRKICKIYVIHSISDYNSHTIKFLNAVLLHKTVLKIFPEEVDFILEKYWQSLVEDLTANKIGIAEAEPMLKVIIHYKSNEDFNKIFSDMINSLHKDNYLLTCKILCLISSCQLSVTKVMILNEYFKAIMFQIYINLKRDTTNLSENFDVIIHILKAQKALCQNKKIAISAGVFDDILSFIIDLNLKQIVITDQTCPIFNQLHNEVTDLCLVSMKFRQVFISDRIPQFIFIFKDLIQSICWYKSDRDKDLNLDSSEIETLASMVHKLENLMRLIKMLEQETKKVAPYLLTFIISLMVTNKRSATLYPKIKTHIENICYDLIASCDPKVESFILRNSNEASRQVYENLTTEYKKYHKFKGKV